jgi:hypothetical protein
MGGIRAISADPNPQILLAASWMGTYMSETVMWVPECPSCGDPIRAIRFGGPPDEPPVRKASGKSVTCEDCDHTVTIDGDVEWVQLEE